MKVIIRLVLTTALIFGVFTETGIWTALSLVLICIFIEMQTAVNSTTGDFIDEIHIPDGLLDTECNCTPCRERRDYQYEDKC